MTAQPNQSLGHGLEVLHALCGADGPIGSRELSRLLGMEHTRVNRLLGTMATLGATAAPGTGFTAMPAGASTQVSSATINTALDGNVASNRSAVDFFPLAADMPAILPGQYLTFKWTDSNESAGTDGHQAIDDVTLNFTEIPCAIYAAVSNVVRRYDQDTGSTDTVDFTLSVVGAGTGLSAGWQVTAPAVFAISSAYGTPVSFTNVPFSTFLLRLNAATRPQ